MLFCFNISTFRTAPKVRLKRLKLFRLVIEVAIWRQRYYFFLTLQNIFIQTTRFAKYRWQKYLKEQLPIRVAADGLIG